MTRGKYRPRIRRPNPAALRNWSVRSAETVLADGLDLCNAIEFGAWLSLERPTSVWCADRLSGTYAGGKLVRAAEPQP